MRAKYLETAFASPLARVTNGGMYRRFFYCLGSFLVFRVRGGDSEACNLDYLFSATKKHLKYALSQTVVFVFQSQIQICCPFFKWSNSSEDVGKQNFYIS